MFRSKKSTAATTAPAISQFDHGVPIGSTPAKMLAGSPTTPTTVTEATVTEEQRRQEIAGVRMSVAFAQVVSVMMQSPHHKHIALTDLEWLVVPPLQRGQWSVAQAKPQQGGPKVPVAVALWASVSQEVDRRLSENVSGPVRLRPDEWKSGDILWLVEAVGDARVVPSLLNRLTETTFKGQTVKTRTRGADGKLVVGTLSKVPTDNRKKPASIS